MWEFQHKKNRLNCFKNADEALIEQKCFDKDKVKQVRF